MSSRRDFENRVVSYREQCGRIGLKIKKARRRDFRRKVFGATKHRYKVGTPASQSIVLRYEATYGIAIPDDLVAFLTYIGRGVKSKDRWPVMAGPYYGIWTLPKLTNDEAQGLHQEPAFSSSSTPKEWDNFTAQFNAIYNSAQSNSLESYKLDTQIREIEFDRTFRNGLLPLCSLGCCLSANLVLKGIDKGTVIYLDQDSPTPWMFTGLKFLDWYEAWADDVLKIRSKLKFPDYDFV